MAQALSACLRLGQDVQRNPSAYTPAQRRAANRLDNAVKREIAAMLGTAFTVRECADALGISPEGWQAIKRFVGRD
jgi:hypothetical protein